MGCEQNLGELSVKHDFTSDHLRDFDRKTCQIQYYDFTEITEIM